MSNTLEREHSPGSGTPTVHPLSGHTGAEIRGVDISKPLSPEAKQVIEDALDTWKVVFFRDQALDHASQVAFGRQFGELTYAHPHDDAPPEGYPQIYTVDPQKSRRIGEPRRERPVIRDFPKGSYTAGWHTDVTPAVNPPAGSILRADVLPSYGGDTTFTNLVAAYEGLSEPVKRFVETLRAEHRYGANWLGFPRPTRAAGPEIRQRIEEHALVANHPVVRVHPRTGQKGLFVNPLFTSHVLDVTPLESRWILDHLFSEITRFEYTVRFHWEPGSVAFWDNRATSHLAPRDIDHLGEERVLHRVTLIGEVPVGPDGRESELVSGVPFVSTPVFEPLAMAD